MHHFQYKHGKLHAEDVPLEDIAAQVGTPFYCYSTATLIRHYKVFSESFGDRDTLVCFSVKSNSNLAIIRTLADLGSGADVVSEGELRRAHAAGIPASRTVFSGVGKTVKELAHALEEGIFQFNVESEPELEALNELAQARNVRAPISLRVNPDVDAGTHAKIATGKSENKFGIPWSKAGEIYAGAKNMPGIDVQGVDVHIGSQITDLGPFEAAFGKAVDMVKALQQDGHNIRTLDLGGGLGIPYIHNDEAPPLPQEYGRMVDRVVGDLNVKLIFEPGRVIAGNAGILVTSVIYVKEGEDRKFLIVDAAMNDLIRPTLYEAYHEIITVKEAAPRAPRIPYDVVGPVCETGDTFALARPLPEVAVGERIAILSAGAYGAVQSSTYNTRPIAPEVLVNGEKFNVIRARQSYDDILSQDVLPEWQSNT